MGGLLTLSISLIGAFVIWNLELLGSALGYEKWISDLVSGEIEPLFEGVNAIWFLILGCVSLGAGLALGVSYWIMKSDGKTKPKMKITEHVEGKHFQNCEVRLDGFSYIKCTFSNVSFIYNGGAMEFYYNNLIDSYAIKSDVEEIERFVIIQGEFNLLKGTVLTSDGIKRFDGINFGDVKNDQS